jgi:hypothetical protein
MQVKEPKLFEQFRPAVKHRDGRIELVKNFSPKNRYVEINVTDLSNKTKTERKPSESRDCNRTGARGAENTTTLPQDHPRIHELGSNEKQISHGRASWRTLFRKLIG